MAGYCQGNEETTVGDGGSYGQGRRGKEMRENSWGRERRERERKVENEKK